MSEANRGLCVRGEVSNDEQERLERIFGHRMIKDLIGFVNVRRTGRLVDLENQVEGSGGEGK